MQVSRAKTQLKASLLMQLDSFSSTAEDIGRQMLTYGRRMSNAEVRPLDCNHCMVRMTSRTGTWLILLVEWP